MIMPIPPPIEEPAPNDEIIERDTSQSSITRKFPYEFIDNKLVFIGRDGINIPNILSMNSETVSGFKMLIEFYSVTGRQSRATLTNRVAALQSVCASTNSETLDLDTYLSATTLHPARAHALKSLLQDWFSLGYPGVSESPRLS